jgi:hypothetical protein
MKAYHDWPALDLAQSEERAIRAIVGMAKLVDILVVAHERDRPTERSDATAAVLARYWREFGLSVGFVRGLAQARRTAATMVVNHVDLSETPREYTEFFREFPAVVNGRMTDISKRNVCNELVAHDAFEGAVIVKTDRNHGGLRELKLLERRPSWLRAIHATAERLRGLDGRRLNVAWSDVRWLDPRAYPIFEHASLVPVGVWRNSNLVVQKFVSERDRDGRYRLRCWYVLGDRGFHVVTLASDPIVKGSNIVDRCVIDAETPTELIALRKKIGMDYGRFDYILVNDRPVIFDVNRTPASSAGAVERYALQWREMASGIDGFWS